MPNNQPFGVGLSLPPEMLEYEYGYEEDGVGSEPTFPQECCEGDDCCPEGQIWPLYINELAAYCCVEGSYNEEEDICCCREEDHVCCPGLDDHCQDASNTECCDLSTQTYCKGGCWPKDKPCCEEEGTFNCEFQNDECVSDCCCNPDDEQCCDGECIPKDDLCCEGETKECYDRCIPYDEYCCEEGKYYCEHTYDCQEHCCDEMNGFSWCEYVNDCATDCCPPTTPYCDKTGDCRPTEQCCENEGDEYCIYVEDCVPKDHCCPYNEYHHEVYCEVHGECRDECDCCEDGYESCLCSSGTFETDRYCYPSDGE